MRSVERKVSKRYRFAVFKQKNPIHLVLALLNKAFRVPFGQLTIRQKALLFQQLWMKRKVVEVGTVHFEFALKFRLPVVVAALEFWGFRKMFKNAKNQGKK